MICFDTLNVVKVPIGTLVLAAFALSTASLPAQEERTAYQLAWAKGCTIAGLALSVADAGWYGLMVLNILPEDPTGNMIAFGVNVAAPCISLFGMNLSDWEQDRLNGKWPAFTWARAGIMAAGAGFGVCVLGAFATAMGDWPGLAVTQEILRRQRQWVFGWLLGAAAWGMLVEVGCLNEVDNAKKRLLPADPVFFH
jgi:hypothetical protein